MKIGDPLEVRDSTGASTVGKTCTYPLAPQTLIRQQRINSKGFGGGCRGD